MKAIRSATTTARSLLPSARRAPFVRAPETARTVFLVVALTGCVPLIAGVVYFGWRALLVAGVCVLTCAAAERAVAMISRQPTPPDTTHGYLTGLLLALTLPAFTPLWIAAIAAALAVFVGKAVFGGVGHYVWQPALVGRLAVAVLFPAMLAPATWGLLAQGQTVVGDIHQTRPVEHLAQWEQTPPPPGASGFRLVRPDHLLDPLTSGEPRYSALAYPQEPTPAPVALLQMPPLKELLYGARPGGIGETSAIAIVLAGMYLALRGYGRWHLPAMMVASAALTVAIAPVQLLDAAGTANRVWLPVMHEGWDVGFTYLNYHLLTGEILLGAVFFATDFTSRPITRRGQLIFAAGCGVLAVLLRLYVNVPIPVYMAILAMNTFTPLIDSVSRPRPMGVRHPWRRLLSRAAGG